MRDETPHDVRKASKGLHVGGRLKPVVMAVHPSTERPTGAADGD